MVHVNGASILYGSLREMIAGLSGRTTHGVYLLPSVSFVDLEEEAEIKKGTSSEKLSRSSSTTPKPKAKKS
jgi:hypothetical protein